MQARLQAPAAAVSRSSNTVQSSASVSSARCGTRARTSAVAWQRLSDEALLQVRLRDLNLRIAGTPLARCVRRLYAELEAAGLRFRPHCWLADEWFSPDGIPGIAIPFYLSHPRLRRLERRMMREVEGGNTNWMMRILRHEAGHAIDSAYRLRRRRRWRDVFGPASLRYPESYRPRPGSRRFVQHLGSWYAQSHPTEDFAETFAVWLKRGPSWRRAYAGSRHRTTSPPLRWRRSQSGGDVRLLVRCQTCPPARLARMVRRVDVPAILWRLRPQGRWRPAACSSARARSPSR